MAKKEASAVQSAFASTFAALAGKAKTKVSRRNDKSKDALEEAEHDQEEYEHEHEHDEDEGEEQAALVMQEEARIYLRKRLVDAEASLAEERQRGHTRAEEIEAQRKKTRGQKKKK